MCLLAEARESADLSTCVQILTTCKLMIRSVLQWRRLVIQHSSFFHRLGHDSNQFAIRQSPDTGSKRVRRINLVTGTFPRCQRDCHWSWYRRRGSAVRCLSSHVASSPVMLLSPCTIKIVVSSFLESRYHVRSQFRLLTVRRAIRVCTLSGPRSSVLA